MTSTLERFYDKEELNRLFSLGNPAAYFGTSRSAVRQLVDGGQLSRVFFHSPCRPQETLDRFLVDKAEIDAFIEPVGGPGVLILMVAGLRTLKKQVRP